MTFALYLHLLAMATFVGGQLVLGLAVVPGLRGRDREGLRAVARRFGWMSLAALAVLLVTGAWMATDRDLWSDSTLHAKLTLFVAGRRVDPRAPQERRRALAAGRDPARVAGDRLAGRVAMSDDPYRMYIVIRRGAFTTLDEGGRMVGLAAVRAVRQFDMPDEWLRARREGRAARAAAVAVRAAAGGAARGPAGTA